MRPCATSWSVSAKRRASSFSNPRHRPPAAGGAGSLSRSKNRPRSVGRKRRDRRSTAARGPPPPVASNSRAPNWPRSVAMIGAAAEPKNRDGIREDQQFEELDSGWTAARCSRRHRCGAWRSPPPSAHWHPRAELPGCEARQRRDRAGVWLDVRFRRIDSCGPRARTSSSSLQLRSTASSELRRRLPTAGCRAPTGRPPTEPDHTRVRLLQCSQCGGTIRAATGPRRHPERLTEALEPLGANRLERRIRRPSSKASATSRAVMAREQDAVAEVTGRYIRSRSDATARRLAWCWDFPYVGRAKARKVGRTRPWHERARGLEQPRTPATVLCLVEPTSSMVAPTSSVPTARGPDSTARPK